MLIPADDVFNFSGDIFCYHLLLRTLQVNVRVVGFGLTAPSGKDGMSIRKQRRAVSVKPPEGWYTLPNLILHGAENKDPCL